MLDTDLSRAAVPAAREDTSMNSARRAVMLRRAATWLALAGVLIVAPFRLDSFWLQLLLLSGASAVGALGLRFLFGVSGQLSLAHAFFIGVGAYGYAKLGPHIPGASVSTVGLTSGLAALLAIVGAGLAGLLFSPVAARLRGIYLGLASLALVVFSTDLLLNENSLGGAYGIDAAPLKFGSFSFEETAPGAALFGTPFGTMQRLWFLVMIVLLLCYGGMGRIERTRGGRALKALRDSPAAAASAGIHVQAYRSFAFVISSLAAGIAGVLLALIYQHIVPDNFGLTLSILYLVMVVLGGPRSALGAVLGALVVTGLPLLMTQYAQDFPLVAKPGGSGGINAGTLSQYVFGMVMIIVLLARAGVALPLLGRLAPLLPRKRAAAVE